MNQLFKFQFTFAFSFLIILFSDAQSLKSTDINLKDFEYPFKVSFISFNIQNEKLKMAYMDVSPQNPTGRCVVLLHGKNFPSAYWEKTARDFLQKGYRVIMPDQVGFGKSSKPENIQYSFLLLARNTKLLLDTLKITRAIILAHSTGGMLAIRFSLLYPQMVERLILEDPLGLPEFARNKSDSTVDQYYQKELGQNYEKIKSYEMTNYYHGQWNDEYDKWAKLLAGWTLNSNYKLIAKNSAKIYEMLHTQPVAYEIKDLRMPVLIISGEVDPMVTSNNNNFLSQPENINSNTGNIVNQFKHVVIPNTGHVPHLESFDLFMKAVNSFLGTE